jgi:meso-butanediol dehydrogenase/(S,S)-butanediol dehydrogenase/diacetyl reductase
VGTQTDTRVIIVTGAGSGIGRATAELFTERGWQVVANDVRADALSDADPTWAVVPGSVADEATNVAMVAAALERWGRLDAMALNAGVVGSPAIDADGAPERLMAVLEVNVKGVMLGIRHGAPAIERTAGSGAIVVTASTSGLAADPGSWAYNASKAAAINLVRAAALDFATRGVRINAVAPGPTDTGMTEGLHQLPDLYRDMTRRIPLQRWGRPREQAEVIWFLATPASSFVTGVTIPCDGGITANVGHFLPPAAPGSGRG